MSSLVLGVVGYGYWGPNLVRNLFSINNVHVKYLCDSDESKLSRAKKQYPHIYCVSSIDSILNDDSVNAVLIATPIKTHYSLAKACLLRDKHVFVEKPLACSSSEVKELTELAKQQGVQLMVGHTFEYSPAVLKIKEIIDSGEIGTVQYIDSYRVNLGLFQSDNSVIWDLAPHDISIINLLLSSSPVSVHAHGGSFVKKGVHDVANMTIHFENGVMAHVVVSWLAPCKLRRATIIGTKKMIIYDDIEAEEKIKIYDKGVSFSNEDVALSKFIYRTGGVYSPKVMNHEPLYLELSHFVDCVLNNKTPRSDGNNALQVVRVLEAAALSLKEEGRKVKLTEVD